MLTDEDSFLRNIPLGVNGKQVLFMDAIRFCVDAVDESFRALTEQLDALAAALVPVDEQVQTSIDAGLATRTAMSVWGMVDWLFRLRVMLREVPAFVSRRDPKYRILMDALAPVKDLRNTVQHLPGHITTAVQNDTPFTAMGTIAWGYVANDREATGYLLQFGTQINQAGAPFSLTVDGALGVIMDDGVFLHAYGNHLNLSKLHQKVAVYTVHMLGEIASPEEPANSETSVSDLLLGLRMTIREGRRDDGSPEQVK